MSVNGFMKILVRALDMRDHRDPLERRAVYDMSRRTLERFFLQSPTIDEASRADQREELEAAIAEIERRITQDAEAQAEAEASGAGENDVIAPPSAASEPSSSTPPTQTAGTGESESADRSGTGGETADERAAAALAVRPARPHLPPADDLFGVLPDDDAPPSSETAIEADDEDARRRNRRGSLLLFGLLLVIIVAYEIGLDEGLRRILIGHTLPGSSIETAAPLAIGPVRPALGEEIARLTRAPDANVTTARLVIDGGGTEAADVVGRIEWVRPGPNDRSALRGRATFPERSISVELVLEDEASTLDGFDRMILAAFVDLPEPLSDVAMFDRIDPKTHVERAADGTVVRIGLDRALYGYRGVPADRAGAFEDRSLLRLRFTLESGRRGHVLIRLPDPR